MSVRDDEIIAQYSTGNSKHDSLVRDMAELHGGIDRVENGKFIFADGLPMNIKEMSLAERWAGENEMLRKHGIKCKKVETLS